MTHSTIKRLMSCISNPTTVERCRILVIGRSNAGKTTILQKICNSTTDPEIYNDKGERIDLSLEGTIERGIHDINNELIFKSDPRFIFHDSPGIEAGYQDGFQKVKDFIKERANTPILTKRIHAIWYCIPMDQIDRAIVATEEIFFNKCDNHNVPVVVVFTKYDQLDLQVFDPQDLLLLPEDRAEKNKARVQELFAERDIWGKLKKMKYPPKAYVQLEDMDKPDATCDTLLRETIVALGGN